MALHKNVHQGSYGEAFVHALACAAGFTVGRQHLDVDGVDWQIGGGGPHGSVRSPRIEVQVKTWAHATQNEEHWTGRLAVKHFHALAGSGFMVPRFLVAVIAPTTPEQYVRVDHDSMILSYAAYWLSLADCAESPADGNGSVQVRVPRRNLLTVRTLAALVRGDLKGATS